MLSCESFLLATAAPDFYTIFCNVAVFLKGVQVKTNAVKISMGHGNEIH